MNEQRDLSEFGDDHESNTQTDQHVINSEEDDESIFSRFISELENDSKQKSDADTHDLSDVLRAFASDIDPKLIDAGWGFEQAKSVEYGKVDQSMLNHVRNGIFGLVHANEIIETIDPRNALDPDELRAVIALFIPHDSHKMDEGDEPDADKRPHDEFDIPQEKIEELVDQFSLLEFVNDHRSDEEALRYEDFHSCAVDHHDTWNKKSDHSTRRFRKLRPYVRLADALASSPTPEAATNRRTRKAVEAAYPGVGVELRWHALDDVKGVFTNLLNATLAEELRTHGYRLLAIYQDGCVYLAPKSTESPEADDAFIDSLVERLSESIRSSHPAYQDPIRLIDNLTTRSQGFYAINNQDFFYTGAEPLLRAVVMKADFDADPDDDPTESMTETMCALDDVLPVDVETDTRRVPGYARLAYTVRRSFIDLQTLSSACLISDS